MKSKLLAMVVTVAIAPFSSKAIANAADEVYIGLQYGYSLYSEDVAGVPDYDLGAVVGRFGAFGTANFAIEGRVGAGVQDDTQTVGVVDVTLELESLVGMYAVGHFNFGRNSSLYGVLGFTRVEGKASAPAAPGVTLTGDDSDISYGIGADIGITRSIALNIEYMSYYSRGDVDINAAAIGLVFGF